jgi:SAM-dependent methyltransferase
MTQLLPEEEVTKQTYDKYAAVWAKKYGDSGFYEKEFIKFHQLLPAGRVIDIGSGSGRDAEALIGLGYDYTGTDISGELLKIARKRMPRYKFIEQSVYELDFPDKFDGFWCTATLLHIPRQRTDEALQKIKSILRPGAIGFITIKDGKGEELEGFEIEPGAVLKRFYTYWSKEGFAKKLEDNGFKVLDYKYRPENNRQLWHCYFVRLNEIDGAGIGIHHHSLAGL